MPDDLKDILTHLSTDIDQETLLLYLQDKLSEEKKHEVEENILDNQFADEALEGLQEFKDKKDLSHLVDQLNRDLKKKLAKKKLRREKLRLKEQPWLLMSIVIILLLIVISFVIIRRHLLQNP